MGIPNQVTEVTTQISPLLTLVQTTTENKQAYTLRVEQAPEGWNPFETEENRKGDSIAAEIYLKPETAMGLAVQILRHHGYVFDFHWEGRLFNPKTKEMEVIHSSADTQDPEPEFPRSGAV